MKVAFGPVGAVGLLLLILALVRRSPRLAALGTFAVAADAAVPQLRGFAALRATGASSSVEPAEVADPSRSGDTLVTPTPA